MVTQSSSDLGRYNADYIEAFLKNYQEFVIDAPEMANEWADMDEQERLIQRIALLPSWEKRTLLGALYQDGRLAEAQAQQLLELDERLLEHAAAVEVAYGPSLGELLRYLFRVGTPLSSYSGAVRVETTVTALAELAGIVHA